MDNPLIKKTIIHPGSKQVTFPPGSKVQFHFQTRLCDKERTLIDDSKVNKRVMELILGKKFKLEVWEAIVKTMTLDEVSSFVVDKSLTHAYPFVSKTLRDATKPKDEKKSHFCGATLHTEGIGYDDLNSLIKEPEDLEFVIELIKVEAPNEYEKETWQMDDNEKLKVIPQLKEEGNQLYKETEYNKAADKYCLAITMLEQLMIKEKPREPEWIELNNMKLPILLNFAQCKLLNKDYYAVIEHCTTVLESDKNNVKALFRRGKAHVGAWNTKEAEIDFKKVAELEPALIKLVNKELIDLEKKKKEKDEEDKVKFLGKLF